jgi:hypothetical protein
MESYGKIPVRIADSIPFGVVRMKSIRSFPRLYVGGYPWVLNAQRITQSTGSY